MRDVDPIMRIMTPLQLLRELRDMGAKVVAMEPIQEDGAIGLKLVEFFPKPEPVTQTVDMSKVLSQMAPIEKCACGHQVTEHGPNDLCLMGCEAAKCSGGAA